MRSAAQQQSCWNPGLAQKKSAHLTDAVAKGCDVVPVGVGEPCIELYDFPPFLREWSYPGVGTGQSLHSTALPSLKFAIKFNVHNVVASSRSTVTTKIKGVDKTKRKVDG